MKLGSLLLLLTALSPALAPAQSPIYRLGGAVVPEVFAPAIHATGDLTKDGLADFTVTGINHFGINMTLVSGGTGTAAQQIAAVRERALLLVDLDGDGILEYVSTTSFYTAGTVHVRVKGPSGITRYSITPPTGSRSFGSNATVIGDLDRDGTLDLAISAVSDSVVLNNRLIVGIGKVYCYSGDNGKLLGTCEPEELVLKFGSAVTGTSDVNGDGVADLAIGARGEAFLFSGANMTLIRQLGTTNVASQFGMALANVGDLDGDRVSDIAVSASAGDYPILKGWVAVYSGKSGKELMRLEGDKGDYFGASVSGGADLNGDGTPDIVIGAPQRPGYWRSSFEGRGYLRAYSGKYGREIFTVTGSRPGEGFGAVVEVVGDVNGDGTADIATVRQSLNGANFTTPFVQVISGRRLMLTTDSHLVSLTTGGRQEFSIEAGGSHRGDSYLVLGSLRNSPGIVFHGVSVPLVVDDWFNLSLAQANSKTFVNTWGTLDQNGRGQAALQLPELRIPALEGLTLNHAAVILRSGTLRAASAATPLTFTR